MDNKESVKLTIDGVEVNVPKGTNLIEAAKVAGVEVPYYCYHPHLSVAGNCRMCQVHVEGQKKLTIACNTQAQEGMQVKTQKTSSEVADAQRATLEFILINHPLDCTVCDQAGHCKLQDYYYEYNSKPSRFEEEKVEKVKAEVLGPEVIYDGERCIVCTRCVRFCQEVTETSELGVFNRGDNAVIGVTEGTELNNELSGTVVDLCPVGALTHRKWRFNSRIWYTSQTDTICQGCSTGCNVKAATRDGNIVHVKARLNPEVNKEWLCDEGRYGFERFESKERLIQCPNSLENILKEASCALAKEGEAALFLSPFLTTEELWLAVEFARKSLNIKDENIALAYQERELTDVQKILVSPDYAPNARALALIGFDNLKDKDNWRKSLSETYLGLLKKVVDGQFTKIVSIGDFSILPFVAKKEKLEDLVDIQKLANAISSIESLGLFSSSEFENISEVLSSFKYKIAVQNVNEKSGHFVNKDLRIQSIKALKQSPAGVLSSWEAIIKLSKVFGQNILEKEVSSERELSSAMLKGVDSLSSISLKQIADVGVSVSKVGV